MCEAALYVAEAEPDFIASFDGNCSWCVSAVSVAVVLHGAVRPVAIEAEAKTVFVAVWLCCFGKLDVDHGAAGDCRSVHPLIAYIDGDESSLDGSQEPRGSVSNRTVSE